MTKTKTKTKTKPAGKDEITTDDLPEGWALTKFGCVAIEAQNGFSGRTGSGRPTVVLRLADVSIDGTVASEGLRYIGMSVAERQKYSLRPGDLLAFRVNGSAAIVGQVICYMGPAEFTYCDHFIRFRVDEKLFNPLLVAFLFRTIAVRNQVETKMVSSAGQNTVSQASFREIEIPVPPFSEQSRIVSKIEELIQHVNACRDRLARVSKILKAFRQAVLAAACSGRLTGDWRASNPNLRNIDELIEAVSLQRLENASPATEKEKLKETYANSEENDSSELPENWRYIALRKLCTSFDYGTSAKSQTSGRIPVLRMGNLQNGEIDWSSLVYTSDKIEIEKYSLRPNTVLFNRTNSANLVGKTAIYRGGRPAIFAGYLIRIVNLPELVPEYLNICLNSPYAKEFCSRVKTDAVSQSNINAQKLGLFEVPYCVSDEQKEIVCRVEALFKLANTIDKRVGSASARAEKLTQAILAKAFRGELVPTEAELARREGRAYESASALLVRISANGSGTTSRPG